jgi:hypothetical protein
VTLEQYVVRKAEGGPDLVWLAEVDFDDQLNVGEVRHAGGLEGQVDPLVNRAALEAAFGAWEADGCQIDRIP